MKLLGALSKGEKGIVKSVGKNADSHALKGVSARLLAMGMIEGAKIQVLHEAPVAKDPIAVLVGSNLIALRREEANLVEVEEVL